MKTKKSIQRFCTAVLALAFAGGLMLIGAAMTGCDKSQEPSGGAGDANVSPDTAANVAVVNSKCPTTGSGIDPKTVPADLVRTFEGKKVGFCCGACPSAWDKLTDAQRKEKLAAAM